MLTIDTRPLAEAGRVVAAINVGTQAARVGRDEMRERLLPVLRRVAEDARVGLIVGAAGGNAAGRP